MDLRDSAGTPKYLKAPGLPGARQGQLRKQSRSRLRYSAIGANVLAAWHVYRGVKEAAVPRFALAITRVTAMAIAGALPSLCPKSRDNLKIY
jgi:hypothetical protein